VSHLRVREDQILRADSLKMTRSQQFLIRQRELYDLNGASNPCDLVEDQREQQVRFHQRGFRVLQHLLQRELNSLVP
jgi:hypothetical protein